MSAVARIAFLFALVLFVAGLPRAGFAESVTADPLATFVFRCIMPESPYRLYIVIPDLNVVAGPADKDTAAISEYLRNNFMLTGLFASPDMRTVLAQYPEVGLDGKNAPDYVALGKLGTDFLVKGTAKCTASDVTLELRLFDVGLGRQILAKRYNGKPGDGHKMANHFTNAVLERITGSPGNFGSEIVFSSGSWKNKQIMKTTLGDGEVVRISAGSGRMNSQPTIGRDGAVAWVRRNGRIWDLVRDGRVVSSGAAYLTPAFKPDGSLVATKEEKDGHGIYNFSADPVEPLIAPEGINISPTFSPDGSQMAFVSDREGRVSIYIASASGEGNARRLTPEPIKATYPSWSPTGEFITFVSRETDICAIRPDGTGFRQLTGDQGKNSRPSYSPDGRMIVFNSTRNGRLQIFVMTAMGDKQTPLMPDDPELQDQPYWSPAGPASYYVFPDVTDIPPAEE